MNKKEELMTEVLGDGGGESFARVAAARVRRRHGLKRTSLAAGVAAALGLALFVARSPAPQPPRAIAGVTPALEILSDQELLAQLRDQPVLILKDHSGITGVVFLADKNESKL